MGRRFALAVVLACASLWASMAGAATLTTYNDEAAFRAAVGSAALAEEDFDGYPCGTAISGQVPGVSLLSSLGNLETFCTNRATSRPAILSGGFVQDSMTSQEIVAVFDPPASAISFNIVAQRPQNLGILMTFQFTDGTMMTIAPPDTNNNNNNREYVAFTSDVTFSQLTYSTVELSNGLFSEFGGWDDLIVAVTDENPPICVDEPGERGGALVVEVTCTDQGPGETGIVSVELAADSVNVALTVDPFTPPAPVVTFFMQQIDDTIDAEATTITTDAAGNADISPVTFRELPGGVLINEILCRRDGAFLEVSSDNTANPTALSVCSGSTVNGLSAEPALPPGYEPGPGFLVLTLTSGVSGLVQSALEIVGDCDVNLRGLFSRSDDGIFFPPFRDETDSVTCILTVPDPTRIGMGGRSGVQWSDVKYAFAIYAEICDGLDNDGDGLIDEGYELELMECTGPGPFDPAVCDVDGDGFYVCGDPTAAARSVSANGDCADQLDFVNLAAPEQCNGIDDDCDGLADEDGDGDTFGVCDDCNDDDGAIFPGATELCNGIDDDCDGTVDEPDAADASTWYADSDGDGFGDPAVSQQACDQPAGFVPDNTDCDDTSAANNPNGIEVCDGADNDCDGQTDELAFFSGFLSPLDGTTYLHRTDPRSRGTKAIPFRFQQTDCSGAAVNAGPATIAVLSAVPTTGDPGPLADDDVSCGKADEGGVYRYQIDVNEYQYNFCTKDLDPDTTIIFRTTLTDGSTRDILVFVD